MVTTILDRCGTTLAVARPWKTRSWLQARGSMAEATMSADPVDHWEYTLPVQLESAIKGQCHV